MKLAQAMWVEAFDAALFACLCSPELNTALQGLAQYKRLIRALAAPSEQSAAGQRGGSAVADDQVIQQADVDQFEGRF